MFSSSCTESTAVNGFFIPKGTHVVINLWAIHHDEELWEEPEEFLPSRFLDQSGQKLIKKDGFMAFGSGKRSCPGESLANLEMFLYTVRLLQRFSVRPSKGHKVPLQGVMTSASLTADPSYRIVFNKRNWFYTIIQLLSCDRNIPSLNKAGK